MQLPKKGMTLFVTLNASQLTDMTMVTVTLVTSSQADLYNTDYSGRADYILSTCSGLCSGLGWSGRIGRITEYDAARVCRSSTRIFD